MPNTPDYLQDAQSLLTEDGFATSDTWYHGTSSALVESIKAHGLIRSGDQAMNQMAKSTMATIGNNFTESTEPVFLTQSKELAFYWANQTTRSRSVRFEGGETPVVFAVNLSPEKLEKVRSDVGAVSLLMLKEGEQYMAFVAELYQNNGAGDLDINLKQAERSEYLTKLGMAYIDEDIPAESLTLLTA